MRAFVTSTSTAGTRPPAARGRSRWLTTPRNTPARISPRQEPLADHTAQHPREDRADLLMLLRREELDHAPDRLGRVDGVESREYEMARLRRLHRRLRGLGIAQLTDQDHVRVGAKCPPQRLAEGGGVEPHLSLIHNALLVVVEELDRVFNRDDVLATARVHVTDDCRERGRLAGAGRAGHQHQATTLLGECGDALRKPELREARNLARDQAE